MKRICILRGSPRKQGNTNALVNAMTEALGNSYEITEFDLYDMNLKPCLACRKCQQDWTKVECVQNDDMQQIFDAILESDYIFMSFSFQKTI